MADIKWIKITTDIFDDEKILLIESLPEADTIITIWFKLLCLAGKQNNSGVFTLNDKIAYTSAMLSTIFRRKESSVDLALQTFEKFGMISIIEGVITIPNWSKHQTLDQLEERKEYMRTYMAEYREKQKQISCKVNSKVNSKVNVNSLDKEIEEEKEEELDKENNILSQILRYWNDKSNQYRTAKFKMPSHKNITPKMDKAMNKALELYGFNNITMAIERYAIVGNDETYYFSYVWTLEEFLSREKGIAEFLDGGLKWENYISSKSGRNKQEQEVLGQLSSDDMKEWLK